MSLPPDFEWGFATAAYQIEGAVSEGGRGPSIWDTFCHLEPSKTNGDNGDVACDHYHRYEEDFGLLSSYGAKAYRFSIAWSRIIPLGGRNDPVNEEGIEFYNNLIDSLLKRGITPWVTLHHWDLPQALHDRYGGWLNLEEIQQDFEHFARICFSRFGDRVRNWITLNEPFIIAIYGYATGGNAPGHISNSEPWTVGKSLILSHARAVRVYEREFRATQKGQIGISLNGDFYEPWDENDDRDKAAAQRRMEFHVGWFGDPIYLAQDYPKAMRAQLGSRLPEFTDGEFALLRETKDLVDFYGQNYYTAQYARHRDEPAHSSDYLGNVIETQTNKQGVSIGAESGIHWLRSSPPQFRKFFSWIYSRYGRAIYVTENGCPCPGEDKMTREESVNDQYRIDYFEAHLDAISQAIKEDGVDIKGYFAWSLFDNLEWSSGYGVRFGVTYTDYKTLERTPKRSAMCLKETFQKRLAVVNGSMTNGHATNGHKMNGTTGLVESAEHAHL
ncbi:hypothetical protein V496_04410 [Pseudogymnoascus sp. VKM F-4515 (FW-2607)]|nr:hypothetical protein V496_04410 [Pseudogymnoascus sp. VKM F-4515 (FW-2607)]